MAANQKGAVDKAAEHKEAPKAEAPKLVAGKTYTVIGTGKNRHLHKGTEHEMSGADAMLVIKNGGATLKDK